MPVYLYKIIGETPLEAMERYRAAQIVAGHAEFIDVPMTYAGRLDPMAEGELLILIGEECKQKEKYLGLDKEYEVEIVFGIETDTYDALGLANVGSGALSVLGQKMDQNLKNLGTRQNLSQNPLVTLEQYVGHLTQEYPPYSSRTVNGRQLHELARAGELPEEMPTKEVEVLGIELLNQGTILATDLQAHMFSMIDKVRGDFRQEQIKTRWNEVFDASSAAQPFFPSIKIRVNCSSGTYMRSLAHRMGKDAGMGAFALTIKRAKIFI